MILADTSAWVEFDRATGSPADLRLTELISVDAELAVTGTTPRGLVDCLIATVALRCGACVLAHDADMARIADVMPLQLDEASLRAKR